ncbi:MAG: SLC13/DASS family transporter [Nitrospirae bacterium]|nr:SLC13/DASS family transporter [Nitrospirota bacterium]
MYSARAGTGWKRIVYTIIGLLVFAAVYAVPKWRDAVDPQGRLFQLTWEGKGAIAVFFLAVLWWWFDVIPAGITGLAVGLAQAVFGIRPARVVFADYMSPPVVFFFSTIVLGMGLIRSGLAKRAIYKTLSLLGNGTVAVYGGVFLIAALLAHLMPATAVASAAFPTLLAVYSLYDVTDARTNFGKGLFTGMAYALGAGGTITLFGASRLVAALGFFNEVTGRNLSFFSFSMYASAVAWITLALLWVFITLRYRPEKDSLPRFEEKTGQLYRRLGPISPREIRAAVVVVLLLSGFAVTALLPSLASIDKSTLALLAAVCMFLFKVLDLKDLEDTPWNTILLLGGVVALGSCLIGTGAAMWLAVKTLPLVLHLYWPVLVAALSVFFMVTANFVINMAVMALVLPVTLYWAPYAGLSAEVLFFTAIVSSAMPFSLRAGYAPNAIAFESGQFTPREFLLTGIGANLLLFIALCLAVWLIWPAMGMPITRCILCLLR